MKDRNASRFLLICQSRTSCINGLVARLLLKYYTDKDEETLWEIRMKWKDIKPEDRGFFVAQINSLFRDRYTLSIICKGPLDDSERRHVIIALEDYLNLDLCVLVVNYL